MNMSLKQAFVDRHLDEAAALLERLRADRNGEAAAKPTRKKTRA